MKKFIGDDNNVTESSKWLAFSLSNPLKQVQSKNSKTFSGNDPHCWLILIKIEDFFP